jgi:hypothetical protein
MTMKTDGRRTEAERLLAEAHAARSLARASRALPKAGGVSMHVLWSHVRRSPGAPVSFAVERAIRTDEAVAARYRLMLSSQSVAHAPFAMAASDGAIAERRVGDCSFQVIEASDTPALLVIRLNGVAPPAMLEITSDQESLRIALPEPSEGAIVLSLDPDNAEAAMLAKLVRDPRSAIFLF